MATPPDVDNVTSSTMLERTRPISRQKTTYTCMNEWRSQAYGGRAVPSGIPVTLSDGNWHQVRQMGTHKPLCEEQKQTARSNIDFQRAYSDLTSKIAYVHPNPGLPRTRQGRIGGTWRHIKEVLGHSGSRVVFVDGLVSVYDERFNHALQSELPHRPHLATPQRQDFGRYSRQEINELQNSGYQPTFHDGSKTVQFPRSDNRFNIVTNPDPDVQRKMRLQSTEKYKGVYRYK